MTLIGLVAALFVWLSGRGAALGFAAAFALAALHQSAGLMAGTSWPLPADPELLREAALLGTACAGLLALWSLRRTTRERDAAEDLHWDSMEVVRGLNELTTRAGANLEEKLARALELGASHYALDFAVACRLGNGVPEILAWRAPEGGPDGAALAASLGPRLRLAADGPRLFTAREAGDQPAAFEVFLGAPARLADGDSCVVAFAGAGAQTRFTATDKELCLLMAQWLRSELELRAALAAARPVAAASAPRVERTPARHDLNQAVLRSESRLRALVAADATLELELAAQLPPLRAQRISLEALVESLVVAAHGLAASGALRIETSDLGAGPAPGADAGYATLAVRVRGGAIDADALARAFAAQPADAAGAALPLSEVEALLRRAGGDLSVHVEPGRGAVLTAFLPGRSARRAARAALGAAESVPL